MNASVLNQKRGSKRKRKEKKEEGRIIRRKGRSEGRKEGKVYISVEFHTSFTRVSPSERILSDSPVLMLNFPSYA